MLNTMVVVVVHLNPLRNGKCLVSSANRVAKIITGEQEMTKEEAGLMEALIRRIDAQRAKIKRVEWALEETRKSCEEYEVLEWVDFIEKVMEG